MDKEYWLIAKENLSKEDFNDKEYLQNIGDLLREEENREIANPIINEIINIFINSNDPEIVRLSGRVLVNISCYNEINSKEISSNNFVIERLSLIIKNPEIGDITIASALSQNIAYHGDTNKLDDYNIPVLLLKNLEPNSEFGELFETITLNALDVMSEYSCLHLAKSGFTRNLLPYLEDELGLRILDTIITGDFCANYIGEDLDFVQNLINIVSIENQKIMKLLGYLATNDKTMDYMLERDCLSLAMSYLHELKSIDSLMWVGNLTRSKETCKLVLELDILLPLTEMIQIKDPQLVQICVGMIRNLSLSSENAKELILNTEIPDILIDNLSHPQLIIVSDAIESLRILKNVPNALDGLLLLLEDERASRISIAAARAIVSILINNPDLISNFKELNKENGFKAIEILLKSSHFQLVLEGANLLLLIPEYFLNLIGIGLELILKEEEKEIIFKMFLNIPEAKEWIDSLN